jgi:hypothetical protein
VNQINLIVSDIVDLFRAETRRARRRFIHPDHFAGALIGADVVACAGPTAPIRQVAEKTTVQSVATMLLRMLVGL